MFLFFSISKRRLPRGVATAARLLVIAACFAGALRGFADDEAEPAAKNEGEAAQKYERPVIIPVEGAIDPFLQNYLYRKLDAAKKHGADLIILKIDSPGGLLVESLEIAARLRATEWAHTVAYVPRESQAISGAAIMSLGCDDIVMHEESQIGDAGAIYMTPDGVMHQAKEKIASYAKQMRDLAEQTGRPPAVAEAMMDDELLVFKATHKITGEVRFVSDSEGQRLQREGDGDRWVIDDLPVEESKKGRFLMVNGKRAVELQLANANVDDFEALKELYDLDTEPKTLGPRWTDTFAYILNNGFVTFLLIVVALVCLYIEISAPGIGIGGILAAVCFMLFFWSRFLGGTADVLDVMLFVGGIICLGLELFVIPGFGVAGLSGIILIILSLILASQTFVIPETKEQFESLSTTAGVLVGAFFVFSVIAVYLSRHVRALPLFKRIAVQPPEPTDTGLGVEVAPTSVEEDGETLEIVPGLQGKAHTLLRPHGKARFGDEFINVYVEDDIIRPGTPIEVVEVTDTDIMVRRVE